MYKQCVPGFLSPPPQESLGYEAKGTHWGDSVYFVYFPSELSVTQASLFEDITDVILRNIAQEDSGSEMELKEPETKLREYQFVLI